MQFKAITGTKKPDSKIIAAISAVVDTYQESEAAFGVKKEPYIRTFELKQEGIWKNIGLLELLVSRDLGNKL